MKLASVFGACVLLSVALPNNSFSAADTATQSGAQGQAYYVDFASGSDAGSGTAKETPWKHCPGDPEAADKAKAAALAPGDTVYFKGGVVYRGSIVVGQSGAEGKPITYDGNGGGFGAGRAIVDGSEPLAGWRQCGSAQECDGNPNWKNIWWTEVPVTVTDPDQPFLFEGNEALAVAQDPMPANPWWPDPVNDYFHFEPNQVTATTLRDDARLTQTSPHAWDGAYVSGFQGGAAWYYLVKVTAFDPASHTVTFPAFEAIRNFKQYAVLNALVILNHAGQYVVRSEDKKTKIFLWPLKKDAEPAGVTMTQRAFGIDLNGRSYVTIQGFEVRRLVARSEKGFAPIMDPGNKPNGGVVVRDNVVRDCSRDRFGASKIGVICLSGQKGSLVERNQLHDNRGCGGVLIDAGGAGLAAAGHVVKDNDVSRSGGIGVRFWQGVKGGQIIGNTIHNNMDTQLGAHAPAGILVWTGCTDTLILGNVVTNGGAEALYLTSASDVTVACNVFQHRGGVMTGSGGKNIKLFHNVIINDAPGGRSPGLPAVKDMIVQNNIIVCENNNLDKGAVSRLDGSHNLYTDLAHASAVLADPNHHDYRLTKGSPAIGAGVPTEIQRDAAGKAFPKDKAPDAGAYSYSEN